MLNLIFSSSFFLHARSDTKFDTHFNQSHYQSASILITRIQYERPGKTDHLPKLKEMAHLMSNILEYIELSLRFHPNRCTTNPHWIHTRHTVCRGTGPSVLPVCPGGLNNSWEVENSTSAVGLVDNPAAREQSA
ncbi:uncharacterized protein BDW47DRAFT_103048 [Aspergillus candidus]|uniref:Uncharacterized protein n=1 Tax=Aspergillus candidus TaxID=41067 RepID=A0A2I2FFN4_ASPCN|nr:hypothetical protein BDW47DRAFT_103048 [Aspergillus candidus]PLB39434.1 hypothetical protein BDW47DRAFT_103048 [Aspergillus candidus]